MARYIYVRCEATTTEHGPRDLASFAHCFVEADDDDQAYTLGAAKLDHERPLMAGYYGLNDYVAALPEAKGDGDAKSG